MNKNKLPICTACGTQFEYTGKDELTNCKICDDPRQFVPGEGQKWTSLVELQKKHKNKIRNDSVDNRIWSIWSEPKIAIGQRAILLTTPHGNVLWDLITLLDQPTMDFINSKGGLKAIVISHPHYYTTHVEWAKTFNCPVYMGEDDQPWICQRPSAEHPLKLIRERTETIVPGVTAIKTGGHFDGSLVLHWENKLFIADTLVTVPSAYTPRAGHDMNDARLGQTTYAFMWSIPNMIPLGPDEIYQMWKVLEPFDFDTTHGAFIGMDIRDENLKKRLVQSMKIQVRAECWKDHAMLKVGLTDPTWPFQPR